MLVSPKSVRFITISFNISHLVPNCNSECVKYVDLTCKFSLFKKGTWFKNFNYCVRFQNFFDIKYDFPYK